MFATISDAIREYVWAVGQEQPHRAWISTDYDTWERNPFYKGPPVRHPEDDQAEDAVVFQPVDVFEEMPF